MLPFRRALPGIFALTALAACSDDAPNPEPDVEPDVAEPDVTQDPDVATDVVEVPDVEPDVAEPDVTQDPDVAELDTEEPDIEPDDVPEEVDASEDPPQDVYDGPIDRIGIDFCDLTFGDTLGTGIENEILIANLGDIDFAITEINVPIEAQPAYSFDNELPLEIPADTAAQLHFRYTPGFAVPDRVEYDIVFAQEDDVRVVTCSITNASIPDICETINLNLRVVDDPLERTGRALGWGRPLDTIEIDAVPDDPEHILSEIAWRVEDAPNYAALDLAEREDFPDSPLHREYQLLAVGSYRICADTISETDEFCSECADIRATFSEGGWAELGWTTTSGTSDLQLHAVEMDAAWFDPAADSWLESPGADWVTESGGFVGLAAPAGPAFTNLVGDCSWYALGVFHNGGEPAAPLFQFYPDGLVGDFLIGPELQPGEFWDIGRIHLPSFTLDATNIHYPGFEVGVDAPARTPLMGRSDLCFEDG